jgi:hypothetical protein
MQHLKQTLYSKHAPLGLVPCLMALVGTDTRANPLRLGSQPIQSNSRLTHILEDVAQVLGYRPMRGTRISNQWAEAERDGWLLDHTYMTLFGKESDNSCVGIEGRIEATVLTFKNAETAERYVAKIKEVHSRNIGFKVIRENDYGYLLKEGNGSYAAVISGGDVLLLEDRSRLQTETIKAIADAVSRKTH